MVTALLRPDASCAVGLLATVGLRESRLYFSRAMMGTTILALIVDFAWLHTAITGSATGTGLLEYVSPSFIWHLLAAHKLALACTAITLPVKLLLLCLSACINYRQPPAPTKPFLFPEARAETVVVAKRLMRRSIGAPESESEDEEVEVDDSCELSEEFRRNSVEKKQLNLAKSLFTLGFMAMLVLTVRAT